ncbi:endonuclease III [Halogranum tailed virus 1]|uniref:Endonuclease III n=1 Tax=Halogranum tailed virus 1 TaxID=1273749 RepID=R4T712_9CAUD|nr:endonuclease III [Halogranum tailed virus 1]AGM11509.1 endonuclease III [Halogranum tailed virus 1]
MSMHKAERIYRDFSKERGPFEQMDFPEKRLLDAVGGNNEYEDAMLLTAFSTCDYNRDAMQLTDNLIELYEESGVYFAPKTYSKDGSEDELAEVLEGIGFRYPNRDAHALFVNYEIIADKYGTIQNLLKGVNYDAPKLVYRLREDDFLCVKGKKIAPMYARFLSDYIHSLDRLWELDIPVDTHIRRLSHDMFHSDLSDDEIRQRWRNIGHNTGVSPHVVDGALWLIGNNWDDWGENYWNEV